MRRLVGLLSAALLFPSLAFTPSGVSGPEARLLVRFSPTADGIERSAAIRSIGASVDRELAAIGVTRLSVPGGSGQAASAAAILARRPEVVWAEPDRRVVAQFTPNDPFYLTDPTTGLGQWGIRRGKVDQAWDIVRGSPSVIVATIDTGVDPSHPDLAASLLPGASFISSPSAGCSGQAAIDDNSHGTHVAGIIGAQGNNGIGIAGVAFGVKILPVKALDCVGAGTVSDISQAIMYAADHAARIINVSLGSPVGSQTLLDAVQYAHARNALVVAAAGNCGATNPDCLFPNEANFPAAYPGVLAVGATMPDDSIAPFSTQGSYLGISAPGYRILSTTPTYPTYLSSRGGALNYAAFSGTSAASPFVAGVAALVLSQSPGLSADALADRLRQTADDLGVIGTDPVFGAGRVNALRAVTTITGPPPAPYGATYAPIAPGSSLTTGTTAVLNVSVTNTGSRTWALGGISPVHLSYHWLAPDGSILVWNGLRAAFAQNVGPGVTATVALPVMPPPALGLFRLRLDLVEEGVTWFSGQGVPPLDLPYTVTNGFAATYTLANVTPTLLPGGRFLMPVTVRNTGVAAWSAAGPSPVHLAAHLYDARGNVVVWDGARTVLAADVPAGASVSLNAIIDAPLNPGSYLARVDLVQEGVGWFSGFGSPPAPTLIVALPDYRATLPTGPLTVSRSAPQATLTVTNSSSAIWSSTGTAPVDLSVHWLDASGNVIVWDGPRTQLGHDVAPGASITLSIFLGAVPVGASTVVIDLVSEGVRWFGAGAARPLVVVP